MHLQVAHWLDSFGDCNPASAGASWENEILVTDKSRSILNAFFYKEITK